MISLPTEDDQYGLGKIMLIWAAAALPMGFLAWVATPWLIPRLPLPPGITYWLMIITGMIWQCVLAILLLRGERRRWTWRALKQRLWLNAPRSPDGRRSAPLAWLMIIPGILFVLLTSDLLGEVFDAPMQRLLPGLEMPPYTDIRSLISPEYQGASWLLALALTSNLFNYFLGEALLFHGVLLPRMQRRFGRHAWLANAVLFGLYHLHMLNALPSVIISNMAYSWPAQRYRSVWMAVVIHGFEGLVVLCVTCWVIWGQPPRM